MRFSLLATTGALAAWVAVALPSSRVLAVALGVVCLAALIALQISLRRGRNQAASAEVTPVNTQWDELVHSSGPGWQPTNELSADASAASESDRPASAGAQMLSPAPVSPAPAYAPSPPLNDRAESLTQGADPHDPTEMVATVRAEVNAVSERVACQVAEIRDQLAGALLDLTTNAKNMSQEIAALRDEMAVLGNAPARVTSGWEELQPRLAAAAQVVETRFAEFTESVDARFDQRLDEVSQALERTVDQQARLEATLACVQKEVGRMGRRKAAGRVQLDIEQVAALRDALAPTPNEQREAPPAANVPAARKKPPARPA